MNVRNALRPAFLAASVLILSCQDQRSVVAPEPASAPVAFRLSADGRKTPTVDVVEVEVSSFRDSAYQPLDARRYTWNDSLAALQVPLHTPLRFRLRGILRRDNRDVIAWTASQDDTLDDLSAETNVVTFQLLTQDTSAPSVIGGIASAGATLIVLDSATRKLELNVPSGDAGASVSFPSSLAESLYVDGKPVLPVDGAWKLELGLGASTGIQLVGANHAVASWTITVGSKDRLGLEFSLAVDNGAVRTNRGDTSVFTLPYVVDSVPHLNIVLDAPRDRPRALAFNGKDLDTSRSAWSIALPVPEAGTEELRWTLESRDSLGNLATRPVLLRRGTEASAPALSWATEPKNSPWGPRTLRFVLKVVGGDSLTRPVFASNGLASASCDSVPLQREGNAVWWQGSLPLLDRDSGSVVPTVSNKLGQSWSLPGIFVHRFDPAGPDSLAPSLSIASPTGTGWLRSGSVSTVTGRAIDERLGKVRVVAVHGGKTDSTTWNPADSAWSWNLDWTDDGDSLVTFTAIDSTGNRSAPARVRLVRDTRPPAMSWTNGLGISGDTLVSLPRTVAFSVVASDAFLRGVTALRNGTTDTVSLADIGGGEWFRRFEFPSGWSTWTFAASDSAGNRQERVLRVLAGDTTGPALTISVNNRASFRRIGDTLVYILPYVLDSALVARISIDPVGDRPSSLSWNGNAQSVDGPTNWTIPLEIPVAGPTGARTVTVSARDSVGNAALALVRLVRDTAARAPSLSWDPAPPAKPWGSGLDTIQVLIVGGDSLQTPAFSSVAFASSISTPVRIATRGDSVWWRAIVSLGQHDSGTVLATVRNLLGQSWSTPEAWIHRFDPTGPDSLAPSFSLSPVPNAGWTKDNTVNLRGTASDARSSTVRVLVRRAAGDTVEALWSKADGSWSLQVGLATDGDTTLAVWAVDSAGNGSSPATVRLRRDTRKPGFSWATVPAVSGDTLRTNDPVQTISVNASAADLRRNWAVRSTTTDTLTFASAAAGLWSTDAPLPQGWSTWTVGATDSAGNDSVRVLRVLRDTIAPTVTRILPATNPSVVAPGSQVTVSWSVVEELAPGTVTIDGSQITVTGGTASRAVSAPPAGTSRRVVLIATDALGNTRTDSSLVLTTPVAAPIQVGGIQPGTSGREFFATFRCPDSGATLFASTGNIWNSFAGSIFVASDTSVSLRCQASGTMSSTAPFAWTSIDTTFDLPSRLATIPDSSWALGSTDDGTIWIVTSYDSAWYRPKGDSTWRNTSSRSSSKGSVALVEGHSTDGSRWFQTWTGSNLLLTSALGTSIATQGSLTLKNAPSGKPVSSLGTSSIAVAYLYGDATRIELRYLSNLPSATVFTSVGASVTGVAGIVETGTNAYSAVANIGGQPAGFTVAITQSPSTTILLPSTIQAAYSPTFVHRQRDGRYVMGTQGVVVNGKNVTYVGRVIRFSTGDFYAPSDSLSIPGIVVAGASTWSSDRVWVGVGNNAALPVTSLSGATWTLATDLPSLTTSTSQRKVETTPSGSAWIAMMAGSDSRMRLYRYHRR